MIEIDGVRVNFPDGWGLVRASNTQPALVLRFEASDEATLGEIRTLFEGKLKELGALIGATARARIRSPSTLDHRRRTRHALLAGQPRSASQAAVLDRRPYLACSPTLSRGSAPLIARERIFVLVSAEHAAIFRKALRGLIPPRKPDRRAERARHRGRDRIRMRGDCAVAPATGVVAVMPADHYITPPTAFRRTLGDAIGLPPRATRSS